MAEIIAQLEELEDLERDLWEERHPGTDIDSDRLLKEVEDEVEATSNLTSRVFRYFLVKVHNCREAAREYSALAHETSPVGSLADEGLSKNIDDSIGTETEGRLDPHLQGHPQDVHLTKETSTYELSDTDLTLQHPILSADSGIAVHRTNDFSAIYQRERLHIDETEP